MKIDGVLIVNRLMYQMEVGQKGLLDVDAITLSDDEIFIDTSYSISEEEETEKYRIQIERTGEGKEDFAINFNTVYDFCNCKLDEKDKEDLKKDPNVIGPYKVKTEILKPKNYCKQIFPRLNLDGLLKALIIVNDSPNSDTYLEDKSTLRKLIKEKLSKLTLDDLKKLKKTFSEYTEEEIITEGGVNLLADEEILKFINKKIDDFKTQQKLDDLSLQELEAEKKRLLENQQYEKAAVYRDAINRKSNGEKQ